jgi:hypothetical protein
MKGYVNYNRMEHFQEFVPLRNLKNPTINNHLKHIWYGFKTYKPFPMVTFASSKVSHSCVFWFDWIEIMFCRYECGSKPEDLTHSQLLEGFKCESKWKIAEEEGIGTRSLAHNTLRGRGACWSSGMGLGRIDKLIHSHGPAHNPHKVVTA